MIMAKKVLSIQVGYSLTKVCEMDYQSKKPKMYHCFNVPTPDGVLNDGQITVRDDLIIRIVQGIYENRIKTRDVVFNVSSSRIASREVLIPPVNKAGVIGDIVKNNAKDYFPIDLDQYELAHMLMGKVADESGGEKLKVNVLAIPKEMLRGYEELAAKCDLNLVALDYTGNSIYQVVKNVCKKDETALVINIDEHQTVATVLDGETILLQRSLSYGVDEAINLLIESRVYGERSYAQAAQELRRTMLVRRALDDSTEIIEDYDFVEPESPKMTVLKDKITHSMTTLISGIDRVISFYNSHNSQNPIKTIWITGVGAGFKGLKRLLTNELGMQVQVLDTNAGFATNQYSEDSFGEYLACFGAAMAPVGFGVVSKKQGGKAAKERNQEQNWAVYSILTFSLCVVVAIVLIVYSAISYTTALNKYNSCVRQMNQLQVVKSVYDKHAEIAGLAQQVEALDATTKNNNNYVNDFIAEMEVKMPKEIIVMSMAGSDTDISMQIEVASKEAAAKVIQQFRDFDTVASLSSTGIQSSYDDEGNETVSFSISITYGQNPNAVVTE